jgi:hypothetical protein
LSHGATLIRSDPTVWWRVTGDCSKIALYMCDLTSYLFKAQIIDRYPTRDYADCPIPDPICMFCIPDGIRLTTTPGLPIFFTFCLTLGNGDRLYGACLRFYENVPPAVLTRLPELVATAQVCSHRRRIRGLFTGFPAISNCSHTKISMLRIVCETGTGCACRCCRCCCWPSDTRIILGHAASTTCGHRRGVCTQSRVHSLPLAVPRRVSTISYHIIPCVLDPDPRLYRALRVQSHARGACATARQN